MQKTSSLLTNLRQRYVLAIGLIAVLVVGSTYFLQQLIAAKAEHAAIINMAGKQRMLSQMVSRLAVEHQKHLLKQQPNTQVSNQLRSSAQTMLDKHTKLVSLS